MNEKWIELYGGPRDGDQFELSSSTSEVRAVLPLSPEQHLTDMPVLHEAIYLRSTRLTASGLPLFIFQKEVLTPL